MNVWDAAPASDQVENVCAVPPSVCGLGAATPTADPTMNDFVNGVVCGGSTPAATCSPAGDVANVRSTVRGRSSTLVEAVCACASVAVRTSSRCDGIVVVRRVE